RAYVAVGVATTDTGATVTPSILGFNRAFIQWAGITAGITQSFYDFYSAAAVGYRAYLPSSDTGDAGWWVWAYTAQLGNALPAWFWAERRRGRQISGGPGPTTVAIVPGVDLAAVNFAFFVSGGATPAAVPTTNTAGYGGIQSPDIVANIR